MPRCRIVVVDLDGTAVDSAGCSRHALQRLLRHLGDSSIIVYATGRHSTSARGLIRTSGLVQPDYLISDVGNRVLSNRSGRLTLDFTYEQFSARQWKLVQPLLRALPDLERCAISQGGRMLRRLGFWADSRQDASRTAATIEKSFPRKFARLVQWDGPSPNGQWWVDVKPPCCGKGTAASYIAFVEGANSADVLAIGDSLNDFDLLNGRFQSAVPSNATERLIAALDSWGCSVLKADGCGPEGTADALRRLTESAVSPESPTGVRGDTARLQALRSLKGTASLALQLSVWPDQLRNWGLRPGSSRPVDLFSIESIEKHLARGRNWWWEASSQGTRQRILARYRAIPVRYLLKLFLGHFSHVFPTSRLLGGMVSGGYIYGLESQPTNDLDLVLLFDKLPEPALGLNIDFPGLRRAFPEAFGKRLRFDRVGLGILDMASVNRTTTNQTTLQLVGSHGRIGPTNFRR